MNNKIRKETTSLVALLAAAPGLSLAQEVGETPDEIVVTAQRRQESVQDVPIAVTPLTDRFLEENEVRTLEDLAGVVPGLVTTTDISYGAAPLSIRGIGGPSGGGNIFADEPVGVYLNDVYLARPAGSVTELVDVDLVQVLRGPQGTLFGRNSTAGAVLITTKRPTEEFEGYLEATAARFDEYRVRGAVSGPLTDNFQGRIAAGYSERGGFADNSAGADTLGAFEYTTVRGSLAWQPADDIAIDVIAEHQEREARPVGFAVTPVGQTGGLSTPYTLRPDLDEVLDSNDFPLNDENRLDSEATTITLLGNWKTVNGITLDTVTAYRRDDSSGDQDSDGTELQLFQNSGAFESSQFSQELRLGGGFGRFEWLVGGFYLEEDNESFFVINNFNGLAGLGTSAMFDSAQDLTAYAVFGDATAQLTDSLSLTGGLRWSREEKDFVNAQEVTTIASGTLPPTLGGIALPAGATFVPLTVFEDDESFEDISPRVIVEFAPSTYVMAYASYSAGFKSGGFNSFELDDAFENENVDAYELGLKTTLPDGRGRFNLAGFFYEYEDLQLRLPVPTGGVNIENVGAAEVMGIEGELTYRPIEGLTLTLNGTWLDTEITEGVLPRVPGGLAPFPIGAPLPLVDEDVSGNELTRAPELQTFVQGEYAWPTRFGLAAFSASYRYMDEVFFLEIAQDEPTFRADDWHEVDLRLSLSPPDGRWQLAVFGDNVTDQRRITQVTPLGGFPVAAVNEPARWGVQLRVAR